VWDYFSLRCTCLTSRHENSDCAKGDVQGITTRGSRWLTVGVDESAEHSACVLVCTYSKKEQGSIITNIQIIYHYL